MTQKKINKRGPSPSEATLRMLCGIAAGMCQFCGCNKRLFYDNVTLATFNNSFVAHIVASSPDGPRGDADRSHQLSDKLDNLMLMCGDHHTLIDRNPEKYSEHFLLQMKHQHEEKMGQLCGLFNIGTTEILMLVSPIKGKINVAINSKQAGEAVIPCKRPLNSYGTMIELISVHPYRSPEYWIDVSAQLNQNFMQTSNLIKRVADIHFSVFPLAPIPLIAKLGELMGDKVNADIYQKTRVPDTWKWQSNEKTNTFEIKKHVFTVGKNIALVLSLTGSISFERIINIIPVDIIFEIKAEVQGVDCIKSIADLSLFWHCYQSVCDEITNTYGKDVEVSIFPAIPVSAAFELGRRYMRGVYPKLVFFDDDSGFFKTITIGR